MALHQYDLPNIQRSLCLFLYLLIFPKTHHCASSGYCPLTPTTLSVHQGFSTLEECSFLPGAAFVCGMQCSALPWCKAVRVTSCSANGICTCSFCNRLTKVDFRITNLQFFLHTKEIGKNTNRVTFPGQRLIAGQPLQIKLYIVGTRVKLTFYSTVGHKAFDTEIRFDEGSVVSNSYIGYRWGNEDRYTPHFRFTQGQELSVFCVVTTAAYEMYFDKVLFKIFPHRIGLSLISDFIVSNSGAGVAKIISFRL
ncbi:hypothetical protein RRG08_042614 [Elysia crispata]|uniref:Galectin n=1 Tax=Elysia crispata TaxID=231223 RepID=A0AAE0XQF9_9GAST|nr:hypothetical protein RRG08_042614 [Elysia crispata]